MVKTLKGGMDEDEVEVQCGQSGVRKVREDVLETMLTFRMRCGEKKENVNDVMTTKRDLCQRIVISSSLAFGGPFPRSGRGKEPKERWAHCAVQRKRGEISRGGDQTR